MADNLGPIAIPDPPTISAFPVLADFGLGTDYNPPLVVHTFDQPGLKTEQRYLMAPMGTRRFRFSKNHLSCKEFDDLKAHWQQAQGAYAQFPYTVQQPGGATETVTVRYENPAITFDYLIALLVGGPGITFLEIPKAPPAYSSVKRVNRFPDSFLTSALQDQFQEIIPLITITTRAQLNPDNGKILNPTTLYLSNQRTVIDGQTYLPRLLDWSGVSQTLGEASDSASFNFGNADGVWDQLVNYVDSASNLAINLYGAAVELTLFHVGSQYLLDLWSGYEINWAFDTSGKFQINAADGIFQLTLPYPMKKLLRACWKVYKGRYCPSTSSETSCPKDYDSCVARGVPHSFGGLVIQPQAVRIKDNSTGVWGFGRSMMTSVTVVQDTVYQRPLQEIYTDKNMAITADVAAGRDESDFYSALGIVSDGPISTYAGDLILHTLDGQPPHDPQKGGGWRGVVGTDPSGPNDFVGISQAPWNQIPPGSTFAGGIAFAEIRRTDQKGLQLSAVSDHAMQVTVAGGIGGWIWNGPGDRSWLPALHNGVWVLINVFLRGIGLRVDQTNEASVPASVMEQFFDVNQAIEMAAICDTVVPKIIPADGSTEMQFPFRGALKEQKPLKAWMQEICNCFLGYFTWVNNKLWVGIRVNSSVLSGNAFTRANILFKTLSAAPLQPQFNWLTGNFGDEDFGFQLNNCTIYDIDHASFIGTPDSPQYLVSTMNFAGVSNLSECARIITTRLREELGGVGLLEQANARNLQFRTTAMALTTMVGDIVSMTHPKLPGGYVEGRVSKWTFNPDFSIDIQTEATADDMYDLVVGPKPADVKPLPVPPEVLEPPIGLAWLPNDLAPFAGDPVYQPWERTFELWQDYNISKDGTWLPALWVKGEMTVNQFADLVQPRILEIMLADGGTLNGPMTVYVAVTQHDSTGQPAVPSNLSAVYIPDVATNQQIELELAAATSGTWTGYDVWAGTDRRRLALQFSAEAALPASISIPGPLHDMTQGLPEGAAYGVKIAAKKAWHGAVAGLRVDAVTAPNQITCNDFLNSTDPWIGRTAFVISNVDGEVPLWNFTITDFDPSTGTITVSPDCVQAASAQSVQPRDVLGVYAIGVSATSNTITDPLWNNSVNMQQFNSPGLVPSAEQGRMVRILRGTGAGQLRWVDDNDATTITVSPDWDVIPDETSIFEIEEPGWPYAATSSEIDAPRRGQQVEVRLEVPNLADQVVLVGGFLVATDGSTSDEQFACFRMIYIFGQTPGVRVIGPDANDPTTNSAWLADPTDQTIRCDTSTNAVNLQLPPIDAYAGRSLKIWNDGNNPVHVNCNPGDLLFDGNDTTDVAAFGDGLNITAG